jgi:predicted phosphodiesterase
MNTPVAIIGRRGRLATVGCLFLLISCAYSLQGETENPGGLIMMPYFIYTPDQHILMKLSPVDNQFKSMPEISVNDRVASYPNQKDEMTGLIEVNLGPMECGRVVEVTLTYTVSRTEKKETLHFQIPSFPCSADQTISFLFIADTHGNASFFAREVPFILSQHPDKNILAIIHGGDWLNEGTDLANWNAMAQAVGSASRGRPILSAIGNHEYHGYSSWNERHKQEQDPSHIPVIFKKYFMSIGDTQASGYQPTGCYSIHYPQTALIFINSNRLGKPYRDEQWSFMKKEMDRATAEKKPMIVVFHHSLLGSNLFRINKAEGKRLREELIPVLEEQVQKFQPAATGSGRSLPMLVVLSAHGHLFEVSGKQDITYLNAGPFGGWPMFALWGNPYKKTSRSLTSTYTIVTASSRGISLESHYQSNRNWE